jgi:putative transposase
LKNEDDYTVEKMFKCMKVSKNAYYNWLKNNDVPKVCLSKLHLKEQIRLIFERSKEIYGSHRIQKMLERQDLHYSRYYIALLMKGMGLKSVLKRKFVSTTDSNHSFPIAKNILDRNFRSTELGEKWVSDITYIRVGKDWNYLTTIMDLADRKIVGWSLSEDMITNNTVYQAWINARKIRMIKEIFIFYSDRDVQYTANKISSLFSFNCKR